MKKLISAALVIILIFGLAAPVSAARVSGSEAVEVLEVLGLFHGTDEGYELEREPTRGEALVMLIRLLGVEETALGGAWRHPYTDMQDWLGPYVGYAYQAGLVRGVDSTSFAGADTASVRDYITMVLRALGYTENADFTWSDCIPFADSLGLTHGEYSGVSSFTRGDMALITYTALTTKLSGGDTVLIERLYLDGTVSRSQLTACRLAGYVNSGRTSYAGAEIYELASSAVFFLELFADEESLESGSPDGTASGFFVTEDGVALMSYHALDGMAFARATTTNGMVFDLTGVLYYDAVRDIAVARISKTSLDGAAVARFPYLDLGDSGAISTGDTVYTLSSPIGLSDSFSAGVVSARSRVVFDPDYPCIQTTAAISSGSSGGALINEYGEAIGVIFGSYSGGNNLYLSVPVNCVADVVFTGEGQPLSVVLKAENEKKASARITAETVELTVRVGETVKVMISHDYLGDASLRYDIDDMGKVISCEWGSFETNQDVPLRITGLEPGETFITITFVPGYVNDTAEVVINVTVVE